MVTEGEKGAPSPWVAVGLKDLQNIGGDQNQKTN